MKCRLLWIASLMGVAITGFAQKKPLDQGAYDGWKSLATTKITDDGAWIFYTITPQRGDGVLEFYNTQTKQKTSVERGSSPSFFNNGSWATYSIVPSFASVRQAKIDKVAADKMPKDTLVVVELATMKTLRLPQATGSASSENGSLVAYSYSITPQKDTTIKDDKKQPKKYDRLVIYNVAKGDSITVDSVKRYLLDKKGTMVIYTKEADSLRSVYAYTLDAKRGNQHTLLFENKIGKVASSIAIDEDGKQVAFLATRDSVAHALYDLYYFDRTTLKTKQIAETIAELPAGYAISAYGSLSFTREGGRLQFNIAPKPKKKPTPEKLPDDEKFSLDLWSWNDTIIQPQQLVDKNKIAEASYPAIYWIKENRAIALGDYNLESVRLAENESAPFAVGSTSKPYILYTENNVRPFIGSDSYLIDLKTGKRTMIRENGFGGCALSPNGQYVAYFELADSSWYAMDTKTLQSRRLTGDIPYPLYNEDDDRPEAPSLYGLYGWTTGEEKMLIADRYDLWVVDPSGKKGSVNITRSGRTTDTQFKLVNTNTIPGKTTTDLTQPMLFISFNRVNKENGYYQLDGVGGEMKRLVEGPYLYAGLARAKDADRVIYTRENFNEFGDLWTSDKSFANASKITDANPQQAQYKWGSVDLIKWIDFNGNECEGLIHYPENYDASKPYPTIVYFYEKQAFLRYRYNTPAPSRSIINPVYCTSNDYIVFIPDINYVVGYPGKSCYDAVVSGTMALIDRGIADPKRIGLQGQSWGGYQGVYLVTQTDIFACSAPGTPVSNMISAYGGIRWSTGISRTLQYENNQSRIGATPWQRRDLYIDNSAIFFVDRIKTPQLIRHCDQDGAVPWYQSIEYYIALRRLGKPAWLLNYNGDQHNLESRAARMDWDKRMYQFFDYYLKDAPMPRWMKEGISSNEKGIDQKLDFVKEE